MYVYLALYGVVGGQYKYFVAQKNEYAQFFNHDLEQAHDIIHGPNSWVFPGGKALDNDLSDAYREFEEETGVSESDIDSFGYVDTITNGSDYKVFFVYCQNIEDVLVWASDNLGYVEIVQDDELSKVQLVTSKEAINLFLKTPKDSSWFIEALLEFMDRKKNCYSQIFWMEESFPGFYNNINFNETFK